MDSQQPKPSDLKNAAYEYWKLGCNIVPVCLPDKTPIVPEWKQWQNQRQTEEEFNSLPWERANGFAVICGTQLNNGLFFCCIDFDTKGLSSQVIEKGREIIKDFPVTQRERTRNQGEHLIFYSRRECSNISTFHNFVALELFGKNKYVVMSPSLGYVRMNDNYPTTVNDLEGLFYEMLYKAGIKTERREVKAWFDREDLTSKAYKGQNPPCISALAKGTSEGLRNEYGIRLASYLLNFRKYQPQTVQKIMKDWNRLNTPSLKVQELDNIIRSAAQGEYLYRCGDPVLKESCNCEECPITPKNVVLTEEQKKNAEKILERTDLLDIVSMYGQKRLIGENNILLQNFIEICSGQTLYPISGIITGYSGSGKNESIRAVKPLTPTEWIFEFTTSTPEAVKYIPEEFAGTLIIYEASGMQSKTGTLGLRAVGESESIETIYPMRDEATGKMTLGRAKTNAKNFITTESEIDIQPDLYRRVLKQSMNPSYVLTKRVCVKEIRDSHMPESLRTLLHKDKEPLVSMEDFQNALRLQDWKAEVVVFASRELLSLIDTVVTTEQQVALRTQFKKILSFIKVLTLLNQKNRVRVKIADKRYVVATPEDYETGLSILSASILETVSRIERRQRDVLDLFERFDVIDKNRAVTELKVSAVTAARALKTLARSGYLKENVNCKPYTYEKIADKPNSLVILQDTNEYKTFYEKELETFLNNTLSLVSSGLPQDRVEVEIIKPQNKLATTEGIPDKTSDKIPNNLIPSLVDNSEKNPLVFSQKTREKERLDKNE